FDSAKVVTRMCFFFFQAEDGIRDDLVTGVQTCALPISFQLAPERLHRPIRQILPRGFGGERRVSANRQRNSRPLRSSKPEFIVRSEERRVGKEWRSRWGRGQYKTIHKRRTSEVYTCAGK